MVKKEETKTAEPNQITKQQVKPAPLISLDDGEFNCYLDTAKFNQLWRVSELFAASDLVPDHYKKKPQNCFITMQMAIRLNVDPLAFMQGTYIVHGKPGMEGKLAIALINTRGPFRGPVQWRLEGKDTAKKCTAYATHKTTGELCEATVSWEMAEKEGWTTKNGSKWQTMPDLMFKYRSAVFLGRLYCPECLMGMMTVDELEDISANTEAPMSMQAGVNGLKERLAKPVESTVKEEPIADVPPEEPPQAQPEEKVGKQVMKVVTNALEMFRKIHEAEIPKGKDIGKDEFVRAAVKCNGGVPTDELSVPKIVDAIKLDDVLVVVEAA